VETFFLSLLQASGETQGTTGQAGEGNPFSILFLFVILFGIMYVFLIMPQKKRDKKHRAMLSELAKNDRVVTAGGIHAIVMSVKDDAAILKIDDDKDIKITVSLGSIAHVIPKDEAEPEEKKS